MWLEYVYVKKMLAEDRSTIGGFSRPFRVVLTLIFVVGPAFGLVWLASESGATVGYLVVPLALLLALAVYGSAAHTNLLTLDFPNRTYLRERGIAPWVKREEGSFDDFERLHVSPATVPATHGTKTVWQAWLVRKAGEQSPGEPFGGVFPEPIDRWARDEIVPVIERLAERMGLPLQYEPGLFPLNAQ